MSLSDYRTLGRSGPVVSPLALGTMTFGTARWGSGDAGSRAVFDAYVEAGGNFIDTADVYSGGRSEEMVGRFIAERGLRDQMVVSTKAGFSAGPGPHGGGLGSKHLHAALDASLKRLGTDHVDLYWAHVWDAVTPAEDLLQTMAGFVRAGKIRHWGLSNAPAWYGGQLVGLAKARGLPGPVALQHFYSLVSRDVEDEHLPLAADAGLAMVPWSPLAYGLLTGKYVRAEVERRDAIVGGGLPKDAAQEGEVRPADDGRLDGANPFGDSLFTPRNWDIVDGLTALAQEIGETPARVALAWVVGRPCVDAALMGVSRVEQLPDNVEALSLTLTPEQTARLDALSAPDPRMLYGLFGAPMNRMAVFGGATVRRFADRA